MGQNGIAAGVLVISLVVLGTADWTKGASLPEQNQATQMDALCRQLVMEKTNSANIPPKDGRCLPPNNFCDLDSDCCSGVCRAAFPGCDLSDWCL